MHEASIVADLEARLAYNNRAASPALAPRSSALGRNSFALVPLKL